MEKFGQKLSNLLGLYTIGIFISYREIKEMEKEHENDINSKIGEYVSQIKGVNDTTAKYLKGSIENDIVSRLGILSEIYGKIPEGLLVDLTFHQNYHMDHKGRGGISGNKYKIYFREKKGEKGILIKGY